MAEWMSMSAARERGGLRLVCTRGTPNPWAEAAKGILDVKGLDYVRAEPKPSDPPDMNKQWTGQTGYPTVMYEDERARPKWYEVLLLAERLAPNPPLIPSDVRERAFFFGVANEICGELGLAWSRRLGWISRGKGPSTEHGTYMLGKYHSGDDGVAVAQQRVTDVIRLLHTLLHEQRARGNDFLLGPSLTAVDIYWATFCNMISPLPHELMEMPDLTRANMVPEPEHIPYLEDGLLAHRDRIYRDYLTLPVDLGMDDWEPPAWAAALKKKA